MDPSLQMMEPQKPPEVFSTRAVLATILIAGFVLRLSGITWGVPLRPFEGWYHPDERFVFHPVLWAPRLILTGDTLFYPTFFQHLLVLLGLPLRLVLDSNSESFRVAVVLTGRFCSVLAGTGAIYLTYRVAREVTTSGRALLAAVLLAFSLYHAQNSAFGTTDVLTSFFLAAFLLFIQRAFQQPERTAPFVLAGVALGLLVGSKYTGVLAVVVVPVLYLFHVQATARAGGRWIGQVLTTLGKLALCGAVSVAVFGLTTPGAFADFPTFLATLRTMSADSGWTGVDRLSTTTWAGLYDKVVIAIGWPLTWMALAGLALPMNRKAFSWSLVVLIVVFFVYFGSAFYSRYVITIGPVIAILAADAAGAVYSFTRRWRLQFVPALATASVVIYSAGYSLAGAYARHVDVRPAAARYLQQRFPAGTTLGIGYTSIERALAEYQPWMNPHADFSFGGNAGYDDGGWSLWDFPRIDFSHFKYVDFLDYPEVIVLSSDDFTQIEAALRSPWLSPDYVWDPARKAAWYRLLPPSPRVFKLYDVLFNSQSGLYTLARTFTATTTVPIELGSPEIRVYVAAPALARFRRERAALSLANVHYTLPYSADQTIYATNPRGYFEKAETPRATWVRNVWTGNTAEFDFPAESPGLIRAHITKVDPSQLWHVQVSRNGVLVRQRGNVLSFKAKAAAPRSIGVGVSRGGPPFDNVGLFRVAELDSVWRTFRYEFQATSDVDNGRIHFDLASSPIDVEIDDIRFESIGPDGLPVALSEPTGVRYRFNDMGCRGPDHPIPASSGRSRAVVLGNSWALGVGVHESDTLAGQLERLLGGPHAPIDVINCGANDYTERDARVFYGVMASQLAPELVVLLLAPPNEETAVDVARRHRPINSSRLTAEQLRRLNAPPARGAARVLDPAESVAEITQLQQLTSAHHGRLAVLTVTDRQDATWTAFIDRVRGDLVKINIPTLALNSLFPGAGTRDDLLVYPGTDRRPNERATANAALETLRFLEDRKLLPALSSRPAR